MMEWGIARPAAQQGLGQAAPPTPMSTTTTAAIGAAVGAALGAAVGHSLKKKHALVGGGVGAALGAGAGYYYGQKQAAAAAQQGGALPAGTSAVAPIQQGFVGGSFNISAQGGVLAVTLPAGAVLVSATPGVPTAGTTSSATWTVNGQAAAPPAGSPSTFLTGQNTLTVVWTPTGAGGNQTATLQVNVA